MKKKDIKNTITINNTNDLYFDTIVNKLAKAVNLYELPTISKLDYENHGVFELLVSTVMSARTKDDVTYKASKALFAVAKTPEEMLKLSVQRIESLIYPVGFYKTKTKYILELCGMLLKNYNGIVPDTLDKLLTLPGVGRKTANLVLAVGFKKDGLCVDTHVHRISNRLGVVKTKTPGQTEMALRKILPKKHWEVYNRILVAYGQNVCKPITPFCSECSIFDLCKRVDVKKYK